MKSVPGGANEVCALCEKADCACSLKPDAIDKWSQLCILLYHFGVWVVFASNYWKRCEIAERQVSVKFRLQPGLSKAVNVNE